MAFTYTAFVNGVAGISISGVQRQYTAPPSAQIATADLPATYPRLPGGDNQTITLTYGRGLHTAVVELCVVLEPVRQSTNVVNYAAALTMFDAIKTALNANASAQSIDRWGIQLEIDTIGGIDYWQLVARVEGSNS